MSSNLRLSPSGPQVGPMSLMPLRVTEDVAELAEPLVLTGVAQDVSASLRASLSGPFDPTHYFSAECDLDIKNASTEQAATVTLAILVDIDGGPTQTVHSQTHKIGANNNNNGTQAPIQPMAARAIPSGILNWGNPLADAAVMTVRVVAIMSAGEVGSVTVEATGPLWLALREHTAQTSQGLRLPPSGPTMGGISLAPIRVAEDNVTLDTPLVLTGVAQDVSVAFRAELSGPFDPTHYFSAECELDVSNDSTNTIATVALAIQVSYNGGAFVQEHLVNHLIGANDADDLRQIRPVSVHVIPQILADWGAPADVETMTIRVVATMSGQAGNVQIEATEMWLRLTEHSPDPVRNLRLSPSGPVLGPAALMPMRINEEDRVLAEPLVLTDTPQDVSASLWAELDGPFDASHYFSAECDLDISNSATNVLAEVELSIQVSVDGISFVDVYTETHDIGANGPFPADPNNRQIRPVRVHVPPLPLADWGAVAPNTETMTVRVVASADGDTGAVQVEVAEMWLRLTEHSAP